MAISCTFIIPLFAINVDSWNVVAQEEVTVDYIDNTWQNWSAFEDALSKAPSLRFLNLPCYEAARCLATRTVFANPRLEKVRGRVHSRLRQEVQVLMDRCSLEDVKRRIEWVYYA